MKPEQRRHHQDSDERTCSRTKSHLDDSSQNQLLRRIQQLQDRHGVLQAVLKRLTAIEVRLNAIQSSLSSTNSYVQKQGDQNDLFRQYLQSKMRKFQDRLQQLFRTEKKSSHSILQPDSDLVISRQLKLKQSHVKLKQNKTDRVDSKKKILKNQESIELRKYLERTHQTQRSTDKLQAILKQPLFDVKDRNKSYLQVQQQRDLTSSKARFQSRVEQQVQKRKKKLDQKYKHSRQR